MVKHIERNSESVYIYIKQHRIATICIATILTANPWCEQTERSLVYVTCHV